VPREVLKAVFEEPVEDRFRQEREYVGHRKVRLVFSDLEALALTKFAIAGKQVAEPGEDLPSIVRGRASKVALRKTLVARERTRVRFWNRVHVGHVELADAAKDVTNLTTLHHPQLRREQVYVTYTVEQAYSIRRSGEQGLHEAQVMGVNVAPDPVAAEAAASALSKLQRALDSLMRRHRKTKRTHPWFWSTCKDPLVWLSERIALEQLRGI
jgi:hypothetical protein